MISKRDFLTGSAALAALPGTALAEDLNFSIFTDLGPFYPVRKPAEVDADLTRLAGHKSRAKGKVIEVTGRVLNLRGEPAKGAKLEVWQANAAGKYDHPGDTSDLPLDPDFQGYASFVAGADGRYSFLTIEPADIVPMVQLATQTAPWVFIAGALLQFPTLAWIGIILFGSSTLFALITLPVEFNASARAKQAVDWSADYPGR